MPEMRNMASWLVFFVLAAWGGLGCENSDGTGTLAGNDTTAVTDTVAGDATAPQDTAGQDVVADTVGQTCNAAGLVGKWVGTMVTFTLNGDGTFHAVGANQAMYDVTGTYTVADCQLSLTDLTGTNACPASQVGVYAFAVSGAQMTLTLVSDACQGRVMGAGGKTYTKS
jgi:hypothetical protein